MKVVSTIVLALAVLIPALVLGVPCPARAQGMETDIAALAAKGFSDKADAVARLAATGDPRVVPALEAFLEGRLYVREADGKVVIGEPRGSVVVLKDPLTLAEIEQAPKSSVDRIRINNNLRGAVRAALGGLTLLSPEASVRRDAAKAILKGYSPEMEPLLETALERETDDTVREEMETALAAVRLTYSKDTAARIEALDVLSRTPTQDVRSLVGNLLALNADGTPVEPDEEVRLAAEETLEAIEDRLALMGFVTNVFQGLSLGSVLLLAAVGLAITFGVMGVINMAHGEMVMIGAYTTFMVQEGFRAYAPGLFDYSVLVAIPAAFMVAGLFGIAIERGIIREVGNPSWMSGAIEITGGLTLTYNRIWIIVFSLLVLGLLMTLMRKTSFGLRMRAVTQNRRMAASMGIRTGRIDALTFGLGSGIAGMAGVALSQIDNVSPNLGQAYIIDSFMVVVFGGVGNLWGTFVGALSLGLVNKFLEPFAGAVLAKILVLVAIILFIQKRPRGLFALKGRAVE